MKEKIAIIILGNRNSGKSSTFYELFDRVVYSGYKKIRVNNDEIEVFLKNTSFEETCLEISDDIFIKNTSLEETGKEANSYFKDHVHLPKIILCAVQYTEGGIKTIEYFKNNGYYLYIQWLNPGFKDKTQYDDFLDFEKLFSKHGDFHKVSGKEKTKRIIPLKEFLIKFIDRT